MKSYIRLLRPFQWIKNVLIVFPLLFHGSIFDGEKVETAIIAFFCFSALASSIYVMNDLADAEKDRNHPTKCSRPIAAGIIKKRQAVVLIVILLGISIGLCFWLKADWTMCAVLLTYWLLNIGYSLLGWKDIPILDLCILASGFLLRLLFGAFATDIAISAWLYLVILSGAFFCGFGKRRNELLGNSDKSRVVLNQYSESFLSSNMYVSMTLMIVFFSLWCLEKGYELLIPFVMVICFRYSYNVEKNLGDGDPTSIVLKDKVLVAIGILFACAIMVVTYFLV